MLSDQALKYLKSVRNSREQPAPNTSKELYNSVQELQEQCMKEVGNRMEIWGEIEKQLKNYTSDTKKMNESEVAAKVPGKREYEKAFVKEKKIAKRPKVNRRLKVRESNVGS
eukprot:TRINITY_DN1627_c0_g1_i1.p1 TRINITY_DN1627_c0_g1~~TRINITY_DN1627_c0_g1_i1.p1  ORF type:complete len:112 (-),score=24.13 TRINITY_DN1627_c0_g1_i1:170-505(-)